MFQTIHLLTFTPRSFCAKIAALWHPIMWWIVQNSRICLLVIPGLYSLYAISSYTICMQHSRYRVIFSDIDTDHQVQKRSRKQRNCEKNHWSSERSERDLSTLAQIGAFLEHFFVLRTKGKIGAF